MEHESLKGDFAKYCIFFGNEEITLDEIKEECAKDKWFPLACLKDLSTNINSLLVFDYANTALDFIKRNYKNKNSVGVVAITAEDAEKIKEKNMPELFLTWPKKINTANQELNIEVFEILEEPNIAVIN